MNPFCSQQTVGGKPFGKPHGPHMGLRLAKAFSSLGRNPLLPVPRGAIPTLGLGCFLLSLLSVGRVGGRRVLSQIRACNWHQPRLCLLLMVGRGQRPFPCETGFIQGRGLQGRWAVAPPPRIHLSPSRCESAGHSGGLA